MERLKIKTAVYIILKKNNQILFLQRYQTGWCDGLYTVPAGHIDTGEKPKASAIRELKEEVGINSDIDSLELVHILYEKDKYIDFYFLLNDWKGNPKIGETEKCSKLVWWNLKNHKNEIVPKIFYALDQYQQGNIYSEIEQGL
jgi:mutator protein MutT